ncbi:unnamed protein product [Lymnaea stagnalis]|uniref:Cytochrome P450 n=1 Tax=Lymnaea stagnalis TaxID=6523 RepID=A0AAV2H3J7_LYMST
MFLLALVTSPLVALVSVGTATAAYMALAAASALAASWLLMHRSKNREPNVDWRRIGIKHVDVPSKSLFGDQLSENISDLFAQYGDTFGTHQDTGPWLVTSNLDLLRFIMIKDFNNFVDRADSLNSATPVAKSLFFAKGNHWRRHRQIVSPTFSSSKLRLISKSVEQSAETLAGYLMQQAKDGTLVPIKEISSRFTCEVIAKIAFGFEADFIKEGASEFYSFSINMFMLSRDKIASIILGCLHRIPYLVEACSKLFPSVQLFDVVNLKAATYFNDILTTAVAQRREFKESGKQRKHVDFLDLLLKANENLKAGDQENDEKSSLPLGAPSDVVTKILDDEELLGHSMLVIFAGLETTATTLQCCLFELAKNPDIQEKVFQEIDRVITTEKPSVEDLGGLQYLDWVINETLRLHPPVPKVSRKAKETRTYNGVTVPQGASVLIPLGAILMNPSVWPEPEKFIPERFSPEEKDRRDPMAFICFGQGPRLCLGMRLAYLELKQALVHVLRKVKVVLNDRTEPKKGGGGLEAKNAGLLIPLKPVMLAFELREHEIPADE